MLLSVRLLYGVDVSAAGNPSAPLAPLARLAGGGA
jgi:hypothetical protein